LSCRRHRGQATRPAGCRLDVRPSVGEHRQVRAEQLDRSLGGSRRRRDRRRSGVEASRPAGTPERRGAGYTTVGPSWTGPPTCSGFARTSPCPFHCWPEHAVHPTYGSWTYGFWGEKSVDGRNIGALRCTLVLDADGRAELALNDVSARGHVADLHRCSLLDLSSA
jgi:hypothetical protein